MVHEVLNPTNEQAPAVKGEAQKSECSTQSPQIQLATPILGVLGA